MENIFNKDVLDRIELYEQEQELYLNCNLVDDLQFKTEEKENK